MEKKDAIELLNAICKERKDIEDYLLESGDDADGPNMDYIRDLEEEMEALRMGARAMEKGTSEWISTKDRLPEADGIYLCVWQGRKVNTGYFFNRQFRLYGEVKTHLVTHWMPLPEPPEAEAALEGGER